MSERELTGYPSIDKPWLKWYRKEPERYIKDNQTIYEMVFGENKDNLESPAIEYLGQVWSFNRLKQETDKAASAFYKSGLRGGDVVLVGVSNCPEAIVTLLALNKIGVTSRWFDIRTSEKEIEKYANNSNVRMMIAFDMLIPKIETFINQTKIEKVLVLYPTDSLPLGKQILYTLFKGKKMPKDKRYLRFKKFIADGRVDDQIEIAKFDPARTSIMIQSSGTTGVPKIISHSDRSAVSCVKKVVYYDLPMGRGKQLLNAMPPWIAYALGQAILYPLAVGTKVILSPTFEADVVRKNIGKFTIAFSVPFHYRYIRDNWDQLTEKEKDFMAKVECLVSGGDKISAEENEQLEKLFGTVIVNGYGNNEGWGALTVNPVLHNKYGTVGIPKYEDTIIAYDNDKEEEMPYGEIGEICVLTDTIFLGYEGDEAATSAMKKLHADGKEWLHTGDLGFVDEEGFVTLKGRIRRVIIRQGFKISAYTIETKVTEHADVKECVAVQVADGVEEHVPMIYVVLNQPNKDIEGAEKSILQKCRDELKEYEVPKYIRIVDSLPYTSNGKYDFKVLEKLGDEYVRKQTPK